jgi:hypothetical protein
MLGVIFINVLVPSPVSICRRVSVVHASYLKLTHRIYTFDSFLKRKCGAKLPA